MGRVEWISANILKTARVYWRAPVLLFNVTLVASRTQSTHRLKADTTSSNRVHVTDQHMFLLSPVRGYEPSSMWFGKRSSRWGRSTCGGKHLQYAVLSGGKRQGGRSGGIQEATRRLCEKRRWLLDWGGIFALLSISTFLSPFLLFIFCAEYKTLHTQVFFPIPTPPPTSLLYLSSISS